jgi:putative membrane protein insertion efficiency factor
MASSPAQTANTLHRAAVAGLVGVVRLYQATVSPLLGPCCRYAPSCSAYAVEALRVHGVWRGLALAAWRVLRCHPLAEGGYDPVPPARNAPGRPGG